MKALYAESPGLYGLVDRPRPTVANDEALVRVASAGLCHTDVLIRDGKAGHVRYPVIPGHEFSGVVEGCGPAVESLADGDRVVVHTLASCGLCAACTSGDPAGCDHVRERGASLDGGFAEFCAVPARFLLKLPDGVSLEEAALVEPLANAVSAVRQTDIRPDDRVVIVGPGPIGLLAMQVARLADPSMLILVGTRDERLTLGRSLGATHTVNIRHRGARERLKDLLGTGGANVAIECAGTMNALELAMDLIGWRGRVGVEGGAPEQLPVSSDFLIERAMTLIGICGWTTPDFAKALDLLSSGRVQVQPLISHTFPLDQWEQAFEMITRRKGESLKVAFAF